MTDSKKAALTATGMTKPFLIDEVPWEEYAQGKRFASRYRQVGDYGGSQHVGVLIEELAPGKQACPNHYHYLEEEQLMMLEGTATLRLGDDTYILAAGSYVVFPAGQKAGHSIYNHSAAPCRYLVIGERNPHDVIVYPDSNRVSVSLTDEGYDKSATMEYWEGEKE